MKMSATTTMSKHVLLDFILKSQIMMQNIYQEKFLICFPPLNFLYRCSLDLIASIHSESKLIQLEILLKCVNL